MFDSTVQLWLRQVAQISDLLILGFIIVGHKRINTNFVKKRFVILERFLKFRCFHYQFVIATFRIEVVMETQLVKHLNLLSVVISLILLEEALSVLNINNERPSFVCM